MPLVKMSEINKQQGSTSSGLVPMGSISSKPTTQSYDPALDQANAMNAADNPDKFAPLVPDYAAVQANAMNNEDQASKFTPSETTTMRTDYPGGLFNPLNDLGHIANNPVVQKVGELGRMFYVPGGGGANVAGLSGAAESAVARTLPNLGNSLGGKVAQKAISEGIVGAPLGAGQTLMNNPNASGTDVAIGAGEGLALGAGLGAAGKYAGTKLGNALDKWRASRLPQAEQPPLALPQGRGEARLDTALDRSNLAPNETPMANPHTFSLPEATDATVTKTNNINDAFNAVHEIDNHLTSLDSQYQKAINDQFSLLKEQRNSRGGVQQGNIIRDNNGNVIDRTGRISDNPQWYQDFYKENGKVPSNKDLYNLAKQHVDNGYVDNGVNIPSWLHENDYHNTKQELNSVKEQIRNSIKETGLNITDAKLKQNDLTFPKKLKSISEIKSSQSELDNSKGSLDTQSGTQDYAGNPIPYRQAATQTDRTINRNQVVDNMRKNLGVTIDTGRLVSPKRGTLGQFKVDPAVIRTRMAEDVQVISHEVGHNLDKRYNLQDPAYQQELTNLTNTVNPNHLGNYQPAQHYSESIAEYFRTRLTDPQRAEQLAPNFTKFLESKLSPKDLKGLESSAKDIDTWITQGEYNQAKGLIDFTSGTKKEGFNFNKFYSRFVDDLDPLRLVEKALKGAVGIGKDSIYKMARLSRGISQRAELAVKRGIYVNGQKVSDGLAEIVKPLETIGMKEKDFATYMAVKHAQDLKYKHGKEVPFDDGQMNAVMQKWGNNPEVQQVHQKIIEYNHALLGILEDAQILSPQKIQEMRTKYPNYVPFMRYFDDDAIAGFKNGGFGAAKGFANITNPIKKMSEEGSTRTIINPIESMVKNTFLVMNAAAKNKVGLQLNELSKIQNAGAWVESVGKGGASPHEHVISVFVNGERQSLKIRNPELHSAMLSLDTESSNSLLRFLGGAASLLRAGATLTPDFMVRNALRDIIGNTVNATKYGFNPLTIFNGLFHMMNRKTGVFDQFLSSGGAMGTLMSLDRDANRESLKAVFRTSLADKAMNVVTSPKELIKMLTGITPVQKTIGILRKGSEISELGTRVGAFNKVLKKTGSAEEAAYQARDLMDFNRAGSAIRPANKAIAFMNANIQGVDRMRRAFVDNPASFLVRAGTTLVLPAASIYLWNKYKLSDDEKKLYDNIPQWQKDSFFVIGLPGTGKFLRIPKPFEAGMLFGTSTERVLRWMEDHDPEAFKGYASGMVQTLTPPTMITALTPMLEAITNHSFFRNAPIVPQGEQGLEKKDQYGLYTSETAKTVGNLVGKTPFKDSNAASPRIIDNTIKGYTAGLGQYAISGIDSVIRATNGKNEIPQPAKGITERQPISSFMASTSGGGQIRQDFYDKWDELSKSEASAKKNSQPYADLPKYEVMKQGKSVIDALNKQYKLIQANPSMSPKEKRAKLDDLDKFMNEIAGQSLGKK